jgi:hypothetical protein
LPRWRTRPNSSAPTCCSSRGGQGSAARPGNRWGGQAYCFGASGLQTSRPYGTENPKKRPHLSHPARPSAKAITQRIRAAVPRTFVPPPGRRLHCLNFTALNSPCPKAAHPHARWFLVLCIAPDTWNQLSGNAFRTSAGRVECVMRDKYRERAAECLRVANDVNNPDQRTTLLDMALAWMRLADQAERNSRSDVSYETPPRSVSQPTQQQQQRRTSDDSD